jgi:hypothetical protein
MLGVVVAIVMCGPVCTTEQKNSTRGCGDPQRSYEGCVLGKFERNGYDDSDFIAIVWDSEKDAIITVEYASTRGWTYHNGCVVDATDSVIIQAQAYMEQKLIERFMLEIEDMAKIPIKGTVVRSTTTRGKNVGIQGIVMWYGDNKYSRTGGKSVGLKIKGNARLTYIDAANVEVINPIPVDMQEVEKLARSRADQQRWRDLVGR